jgi:hypothetical protein
MNSPGEADLEPATGRWGRRNFKKIYQTKPHGRSARGSRS